MNVRKAILMCFICKKRNNIIRRSRNFDIGKSSTSRNTQEEFLIKAMHDMADIFNSHHEKVYYQMNDFLEFTDLASHDFINSIHNPKYKRSYS